MFARKLIAEVAGTTILCLFGISAAVSVVAMATVRDLFTGSAAATLLSRLMLVMGIAPIVAPTIGGAVLAHTSWRGVFVLCRSLTM